MNGVWVPEDGDSCHKTGRIDRYLNTWCICPVLAQVWKILRYELGFCIWVMHDKQFALTHFCGLWWPSKCCYCKCSLKVKKEVLDIKFTDYGNWVTEQASYVHLGLVIICNKSRAATINHPLCNRKVKSIVIFVMCMIFHNLNGAFFLYIS
jgi:hypothetical protein